MILTQSKDGANLAFCYHTHFQADLSAFSGNAIPEMRILPDCERFFLITRTICPAVPHGRKKTQAPRTKPAPYEAFSGYRAL
jgi:hypothetical protein